MADDEGGEFAQTVMDFMESLDCVKAAVLGYRADLINNGIDPDAADTMIIDVHSYFLDVLRSPYTQQMGGPA